METKEPLLPLLQSFYSTMDTPSHRQTLSSNASPFKVAGKIVTLQEIAKWFKRYSKRKQRVIKAHRESMEGELRVSGTDLLAEFLIDYEATVQ